MGENTTGERFRIHWHWEEAELAERRQGQKNQREEERLGTKYKTDRLALKEKKRNAFICAVGDHCPVCLDPKNDLSIFP